MNLLKKSLIATSIVLLTASLSGTSFAAQSRISGSNRYETSVAISQSVFKNADTAVIASGETFADALAAGPLATTMNGPLLLSRKSALPESVRDELKRLNVKKVYLIGGKSTLDIELPGYEVERIAGKTRIDTAKSIYDEIKENSNVSGVFLADGRNFPDALAIGAVAAQENTPILLNANGTYPVVSKTYTAIGGLSSNPAPNFMSRIAGTDRFQTCFKIKNHYFKDNDTVILVDSKNYPDALASISVAKKYNAPIVLWDSKNITDNRLMELGFGDIIIVGGKGSVADLAETPIQRAENMLATLQNKLENAAKKTFQEEDLVDVPEIDKQVYQDQHQRVLEMIQKIKDEKSTILNHPNELANTLKQGQDLLNNFEDSYQKLRHFAEEKMLIRAKERLKEVSFEAYKRANLYTDDFAIFPAEKYYAIMNSIEEIRPFVIHKDDYPVNTLDEIEAMIQKLETLIKKVDDAIKDGSNFPGGETLNHYQIDSPNSEQVYAYGYYDDTVADKLFELLNAYRKENGLNELKRRDDLEEIGRIRARELSILQSHTRPNNEDCFSLGGAPSAENILYDFRPDPEEMMSMWVHSAGHNENMLGENHQSVTIKVFVSSENGHKLWRAVQYFSYE